MSHRIMIDADLRVIAQALQDIRPGASVELKLVENAVRVLKWEHAEGIPTDAEIAQAILDGPTYQQQRDGALAQEIARVQDWRRGLTQYVNMQTTPTSAQTVAVLRILIRVVLRIWRRIEQLD